MNYKTLFGDKKIHADQQELGSRVWPKFMQHDAVVTTYWESLYTRFLDFQFAAYSDKGIIGVGNSIPIHWEGDYKNLPQRGLDWAMEKANVDFEKGLSPNLLVGVQILINPELRSKGLSYEFLELMKQAARSERISQMALPVRPTQKHLYPLIPMEEYLEWQNENGEPFDAWIRVHRKAGGEIVSICSQSMTIEGNVDEWHKWTGLTFQSSGPYTIDKALSPVEIDLNNNTGTYVEPNVWVFHTA